MSTQKFVSILITMAVATSLAVLTLDVPPAAAATLEIAGPAGTSLSVDGRPLGFLPLDAPLELAPGYHEIRCELPGHVPYRQKLRLRSSDAKQRLVVRLTPLSRRVAWSSNLLLAGLGQFYVGHSVRGWVYAVTEAGGLLTALAGEAMRSNAHDEYLLALDRYNSAVDGDEILQLRTAVAAEWQDEKDAADLRDLGLIVAGGAVVVSILDALLTFPEVAAGAGSVPPRAAFRSDDGPTAEIAFHAGVRLDF